LVDEAKTGAFLGYAEHMMLQRESGERFMVEGVRDGIVFAVEGLSGATAMALVSGRRRGRKIDRLRDGVPVHDAFESKASYGGDHPPGVAVILEGFAYRTPRKFIGKVARIISVDGDTVRATIDDVRNHGVTIGLFFNKN